MKTAAIYARVSTSDQVKGTSLGGQVALCQAYAEEHGYTVIKIMQEDASGARLDRPKLEELRDMAATCEIDALIVFDPDRLSRSMTHTMLLMDEFERNKVPIEFVNTPKENTPEGDMLFGMRALFAQYERTKIMERTRRGKERAAREGKVICSGRSAPFGYRYRSGAFELNEAEAVWVKHMFDWVALEHCTLSEVRRRLETAGVPTRRGAKYWYQGTIRGILGNSIYSGQWYWNKREAAVPRRRFSDHKPRHEKSGAVMRPKEEWIPIATPAVVTSEIFEIAQRQLAFNKADSRRNRKHEYSLSGMLFCKQCSRRLSGAAANGYRYYRCTSKQSPDLHAGCRTKQINADKVEALVWSALVKYLSNPDIILDDIENSDLLKGRQQLRDEADLAACIGSELSLKAEDDRWMDAYGKGSIDTLQLKERLDATKKKREGILALRAEIEWRMVQRANAKASRVKLEDLCRRSQRGLQLLPDAEKREYLQALEIKGIVDGDKLTITGIIRDIVLSLTEKYDLQLPIGTPASAGTAEANVIAYAVS